MQDNKYKAFSKELGFTDSVDFKSLISGETNFSEYDTYLQYLGFNDANAREVYEGDVLRLAITDELMDSTKNMFFNSNLGIHIAKMRETENVTGFILHLDSHAAKCRSMYYRGYFEVDGFIKRYAGCTTLISDVYAQDCDFPRYICEKGAYVIGNSVENDNVLLDMSIEVKD